MKIVLSVVLAGLLLMPSEVVAQNAGRRRVGLGLSGGLSTLPDAFVSQCGVPKNGGGAGVLGAASFLFRPWGWITTQADLSATVITMPSSCLGLVSRVRVGYDRRDLQNPTFLSTVRIGLETPPRLPLLRATIGTGRVLGGTQPSLMVWGIATGTRGPRARLLIEWDQYRARVNAEEVRSNGQVDTSRTPMVVRPRWSALRVGVELPITR